MKCPYCNRDMLDGKALLKVQGNGQLVIMYEDSKLEYECNLQSRAFQQSGDEVVAFYCPNCGIVFPECSVYATVTRSRHL